LKRRRHRPVLLIDAGVPRDIEPGAGDIEGAFVYDLDDLERLATQAGGRAAASSQALGILEDELAAFLRARAERPAAPVVTALRRHFEEQRREVLENGGDAEAATRLLINRLLHRPSEALRRAIAADPTRAGALEEAVRLLFGLPADGSADADCDRKREEP